MHGPSISTVAALLLATFSAEAFELKLTEPALNLSIPGIPAIALHEQATSPESSKRLLVGQDSSFTVELELSRQATEMSPRICAGLLLRGLLAQPGMPKRDNVYRAPLDGSTFLVIYALSEGQEEKLHAHVISSVGTSHCANAHFARRPKPGEDLDDWRTTFTSARVLPPAR